MTDMNPFDFLIVQPVFNVLVLIYGLLPGNDFGIALILFTILVRLAMWPLIKKQLHQTKVMRDMQPELKRIKKKTKGNKQLEAQLMMELYRERGVNPFSSIGILLVQLPIFIALFQVVNIITTQRDRIGAFTYDAFEQIPAVKAIISNPDGFNETLLGLINLAQVAISSSGLYLPAVLLAVLAAIFQYIQSKQITPEPTEKKRLRDMLKEQAAGKEVDQSEISAALSSRMIILLPFITLVISLYLPGALVLYFAVSSIVAVIQQYFVLRQDVEEMEQIADSTQPVTKSPKNKSAAERAKQATPAEVVEQSDSVQKTKPQKKRKGKKRR